MSSYTEQDEIEALKAWWKNYGGALIIGIGIGVAILVGNRYWVRYQEETNQAAATLYGELLQQMNSAQLDAARASSAKLTGDYGRTPYAGLAALALAKLQFDAGDTAAARGNLEWAMANATDAAVAHSARLRLGRLLLQAGDHAGALALINLEKQAGFETEYEELRGDVLVAQGKPDEARAAYRAAIEALAPESPYRAVLTMKGDDLGAEPRP